MLKIRKDVDLKTLEKYGFEREHCDAIMEYLNNYIYKIDGNSIEIDMNDRKVDIYVEEDYFQIDDDILNKLYDLINDGLIEKENKWNKINL